MKEFWDYKAKKYPAPFDVEVLNETLKTIRMIEKFGVDFNDKRIVDIGCGTGIYGIVFARLKNARTVLCIDFSNAMIQRLKEQINLFESKNVDVLLSSFADLEIEKYYKYFDISFASMTPAISSEKDVLKMELLSREFCIYIGWVERRYNSFFDELYKFLGMDYKTPPGFYNVRNILDKIGRDYKSFLFDTSWQWKGDYNDVIEEISIRNKDISFNREIIKDFVLSKFPKGEVETTIYATEGVLIWKV